jgi:hypothetical protein
MIYIKLSIKLWINCKYIKIKSNQININIIIALNLIIYQKVYKIIYKTIWKIIYKIIYKTI